ncbi:phage portal protein [Paenirhodobacter populi]|uniref:phage portal protein n=1 Tax=Paenirhodobacter populi TaxID=2306993 RepID=UPI000FE2AAFA|nr:phage portal protein [Sinirhodobacter populi]RWR09799.1 phage portal protein [Sinirhodobacter populi]
MKLWPFSRKSMDPRGSGNRYYQEHIIERAISEHQKQLRVTASMAAGMRIAEGVASLPITVGTLTYDGRGRAIRKPIREGDLTERLTIRPNDWMTPAEFVEHMTMWAAFHGVGRAYIDRGYKGKIRALIPVNDGATTVRKEADTGKVWYDCTIPGQGYIRGLTRRDFIEVTAPRWIDIEGLNVTREIDKVLKLALTLEDRQLDDGKKKAVPGYITTEQQLSPASAKMVFDALKEKIPGTPIFDSGAKYNSIVATQAEMQLLETRRFIIEEVSRAYGIHPIFLAHDAAGQSLTRIADAMDYHVTVTLGPWVKRWEQAIQFSLLDAGQYIDFDETQFYRMDLAARADYAAKALGNNAAWETPNGILEWMGKNPIEGGDVLPATTAQEAPSSEAPDGNETGEA